ncbi:uncharacterized protein LOC142907841 [Petromyzon marinus]|uniref:uncharacterized protein LOC142907841 n=1 Tax=Petromyzon marinus TaxID=7757 RepID=UPI003F709985
MLRVAVATVADAAVSVATGGGVAVELSGSLGGLGLGDLTAGVTGVGRSRGGADGVAVVAVGNLEARPRRRRSAALAFTVQRGGVSRDGLGALRVSRCRVRAGSLLYRHPGACLRLLGRSLGEMADALRDALRTAPPLRESTHASTHASTLTSTHASTHESTLASTLTSNLASTLTSTPQGQTEPTPGGRRRREGGGGRRGG